MDDVWAEALRGADPGNAELLVTHLVDVTVSVVPATPYASDRNSGKIQRIVSFNAQSFYLLDQNGLVTDYAT